MRRRVVGSLTGTVSIQLDGHLDRIAVAIRLEVGIALFLAVGTLRRRDDDAVGDCRQ